MTEAQVRGELRSWVLTRCPRLRAEELHDDTPLMETRILTSLHVLDLLLLVEELSGRPVDVDQLRPGAFRNIDTLWERFFVIEHGGAAPHPHEPPALASDPAARATVADGL